MKFKEVSFHELSIVVLWNALPQKIVEITSVNIQDQINSWKMDQYHFTGILSQSQIWKLRVTERIFLAIYMLLAVLSQDTMLAAPQV